jgi:hypothetical protein
MALNLRKVTSSKNKLREKLAQQENQSGELKSDFLPFFKLKERDALILRFLSDANEENDAFWYIEELYNLGGKSMKPDPEEARDVLPAKLSAELFKIVKKYPDDDPFGQEIRDRALKFYKKKKYLANCYIVDAPDYFWEEAGLDPRSHSDRTKVISLPKKVYEIIKDTIMDEDYDGFEFYNFDDNVLNFKLVLKKNSIGKNEYTLSKFENKPKPIDLTDEEIEEIAESIKDLSKIYKVYPSDEIADAVIAEIEDEENEEIKEIMVDIVEKLGYSVGGNKKSNSLKTKSKAKEILEDDEEDEEEVVKPKKRRLIADDDEDEEDEEEVVKPKKRRLIADDDEDDEDEDDSPLKRFSKKRKLLEDDDEDEEDEEDDIRDSIKSKVAGLRKKLNRED